MELSIVEPTKINGKKGAQSASKEIIVYQKPQTKGKNAKKNAKKRARRRAVKSGAILNGPTRGPVEYYVQHMKYPDLLGPFRQPRFGASNRTGLGMIKGRGTIVGNGTNVVQGIQLLNRFSTAAQFTTVVAVDEVTGFTFGASTPPSVVFPAVSQVADVNITSCDIVVSYLSEPTLVTGQLLIGSSIPFAVGATYSSIYDYPTTLRFPIAQITEEPLRAYGRKISEAANEFLPTGTTFSDYDSPYVITSGLAAGKIVAVDFTLNYEYRSTTVAGSVIPFEKSDYSKVELNEAFQTATDLLSGESSPVDDALPPWYMKLGESLSYYANRGVENFRRSGALSNIAKFMSNRYLQNLQANNYRPRPITVGWRDEL